MASRWVFSVPTEEELAQMNQAEEIYPALCYTSRMGTFTQRSRRSLAGHMPYAPDNFEDRAATFTIDDATSEVEKFLVLCGYKVAGKLPSNCVFHIDVFASEQGYSEAEVQLGGKQLTRAQSYHISPEVSDTVNICILVGVFKIWKTPQMFLFMDPWTLVLEERLFLTNPTCYAAKFIGEPPSVDLLDLESRPEQSPGSRSRTLGALTKRWKRGGSSSNVPRAPAMYRYERLKGPRDIRLMSLEPGSGEMPLNATVVHVTLDYEDMPDFCAISYQWGADLKPYEIETPHGKIPITNSLHGALRCVRKSDQPLMVWADAACINQDDNHEKCAQIRLMAQIFKAANPVYAWIGEEGDRSSEVMETLIQVRTVALRPDCWPEALPPVPEHWRGRSAPLKEDKIWDALDAMLARGWFKRAWVVQEVVLAPRVVLCCGNWSANLDDIFEALNICMRRGRFGVMKNSQRNPSNNNAYAAYVLGMTRKSYANPLQRRKYDFLSLTDLFSYTQSTIPRDKLFSLLLLACDAADLSLNPDYESSEETVIRRYARTFVKRGEASRLLYRAGKSRSYSFCSWIPEWTRRETPGTISDWCGSQGRFSASLSEPIDCDIVSLHDKDHLQIRGVVVDTIQSVGSITLQHHDAITYLNALRQSIAGLTEYPTGDSISNLQLRIPVGGALHAHLDTANDMAAYEGFLSSLDGDNDQDVEQARERQNHQSDNLDYEGIRSTITSIGEMVDFLKQPQSLRGKTWKYWHTAVSLAKRLSCARFCVTRRGYAGLVPQTARVGQEIVVLHVTKSSDRRGRRRLVFGEAGLAKERQIRSGRAAK
ncbi:hypothetical protein N0V84_005117 [Fusarium piperis]|uniref:Heterokaryon incompatibility domain-containing protein n=1 Tax=Fusarium piperis TaxID=1435070 RepID=A0A9W9BQJ7_9HYPO|nr:hypothetical protein N0V84_005117 [Fusarium piperis]